MNIPILIIIVVLSYIIFSRINYDVKEHYSGSSGFSSSYNGGSASGCSYIGTGRTNLLGPTINGLDYQDDAFQTNYAQNIDPYSLEVHDGNIIMVPYNNNTFNTFNENNVRESLMFASLREILRNVKSKLNSKDQTKTNYGSNDAFRIDVFKLNNSNVIVNTPIFRPIISTIINSINTMNNTLTVKQTNINKYLVIFNKEQNLYIVDSLIDIQVSHPLDNLFTNKINAEAIKDDPYTVSQYQDKNSKMRPNNTLPLQLIIKFTVKPSKNNNTNDNIIYVNDLSVIQKQ
jgi:hypothetical protein